MFLLPIGRDNAVIARHAVVTYGIIGLYVATFAVMAISNASHERGLREDAYAADVIINKYPSVVLPKQLEVIMGKEKFKEVSERLPSATIGGDRKEASAAQQRLDQIAVSAVDHYRHLGQIKYAYFPAESSLFKVLIAMWVQFSFLVVLIDCFLLFSTAPYLEDVFGRPAFAIMYTAGAFAAANAFAATNRIPTLGLYGAAGAVSAVIGAFFVRFFKSKLEFFFVPFLWRPQHRYRFFVPSWVVIPLWAGLQIWESTKETGAGAIVNLGGFVFGVFYAAGLKLAKYEDRHVRPIVAQETEWVLNAHLNSAFDARDAGDTPSMQGYLTRFFVLKPANDEELQTAVDLTHEALSMPGTTVQFCTQAAAFLDRHRRYDVAVVAYDKACQLDPNSAATVRLLVRMSALKKQNGDVIGARTALMRAKSHAACPEDVRATIDARLAQLKA